MLAIDHREGRTILRFNGAETDGDFLVVVRRLEPSDFSSRPALESAGEDNNNVVNWQWELARALMEVARLVTSAGRARPPNGPAAVAVISDPSSLPSNLFSTHERDVIPLLLESLSNRFIAQCLRIEESAAKARLRTIYKKLGVTSRSQAILTLLARHGRLSP
jgi:DNA-binding CsgD family transcriptional regulator